MTPPDRDPRPPLDRPGNAGAPYTWSDEGLWDRARALGIAGRSGLTRAALAELVASRLSKGG